mmetsp:Transcript_913/g.1273  ORF Transcript_913/g.1273 Transcript_913/m.1273 type:complete len:633 (-) Transcript_913:936-2834(-)
MHRRHVDGAKHVVNVLSPETAIPATPLSTIVHNKHLEVLHAVDRELAASSARTRLKRVPRNAVHHRRGAIGAGERRLHERASQLLRWHARCGAPIPFGPHRTHVHIESIHVPRQDPDFGPVEVSPHGVRSVVLTRLHLGLVPPPIGVPKGVEVVQIQGHATGPKHSLDGLIVIRMALLERVDVERELAHQRVLEEGISILGQVPHFLLRAKRPSRDVMRIHILVLVRQPPPQMHGMLVVRSHSHQQTTALSAQGVAGELYGNDAALRTEMVQSLQLHARVYIPDANVRHLAISDLLLLSRSHPLAVGVDGQALDVVAVAEEEALGRLAQVKQLLVEDHSQAARVIHDLHALQHVLRELAHRDAVLGLEAGQCGVRHRSSCVVGVVQVVGHVREAVVAVHVLQPHVRLGQEERAHALVRVEVPGRKHALVAVAVLDFAAAHAAGHVHVILEAVLAEDALVQEHLVAHQSRGRLAQRVHEDHVRHQTLFIKAVADEDSRRHVAVDQKSAKGTKHVLPLRLTGGGPLLHPHILVVEQRQDVLPHLDQLVDRDQTGSSRIYFQEGAAENVFRRLRRCTRAGRCYVAHVAEVAVHHEEQFVGAEAEKQVSLSVIFEPVGDGVLFLGLPLRIPIHPRR